TTLRSSSGRSEPWTIADRSPRAGISRKPRLEAVRRATAIIRAAWHVAIRAPVVIGIVGVVRVVVVRGIVGVIIAVIVWVVPVVSRIVRRVVIGIERVERCTKPDTKAEAAAVVRAATKARRIEIRVAMVVVVPVVIVVVRVVIVVRGVVVPRHVV